MSETIQTVTFIDHIGRTIIGEIVDPSVDSGASFLVKNPAIIHVQPTQQGQLNVQTIPLYFREFIGEKSKENGTTWKYHYANVVFGVDVDNDPRLVDQYTKLWTASVAAPTAEPSVVRLFDEE